MADAAFSEDGKYFSALSEDGRLRIWDTETNVLKQEYTPDLHLSSPTTCLQWLTTTLSSEPRGKRSSVSETQCIALGMKNGKILLYVVAQARVETLLSDKQENSAHNESVTSLDWSRNSGLYSASKDNFIHEWDLSCASVINKYNVNVYSKSKQADSVSAIKLIPYVESHQVKFIITASSQLRLWRLHNSESVHLKSFGHRGMSKSLLTIAKLENKCYVIEGTQKERLLSFWDVTITPDYIPKLQMNGDGSPSKKHKRKSIDIPTIVNPTYNFILEDAPKMVDVFIKESDSAVKVELSSVTRSGVLHYYGHMLNGPSTKPVKPCVTVQMTTQGAKPLPLHCCQFTQISDKTGNGEIVVGYLTPSGALNFEKVVPNTKSKSHIIIRDDPTSQNDKHESKQSEATKIKSDDSIRKVINFAEPSEGVARKRTKPGTGVEAPMESRLANLELDTKSRGKNAVNQNLTKLLVQGLHSNDDMIILTVLQKNDADVAFRTLSGFPVEYVPQLLDKLIKMASVKTSQCMCVCTWLTALTRSHSGFLLATINTPQNYDKIAQLIAVLSQRRSHLCQLLNLKGRLDLTLAQRDAQNQSHINNEPILNYNDTSSEDEMEVDQYQSDNESFSDNEFDSEENEAESDGGD